MLSVCMWLLSIFLLRANISLGNLNQQPYERTTGKMPTEKQHVNEIYIWCDSIQSNSSSASHLCSFVFPFFMTIFVIDTFGSLSQSHRSCSTRASLWFYRERVLVHTHHKKNLKAFESNRLVSIKNEESVFYFVHTLLKGFKTKG